MDRRKLVVSRVPAWDVPVPAPPVVETFHLLAETGDVLATEASDELRTE